VIMLMIGVHFRFESKPWAFYEYTPFCNGPGDVTPPSSRFCPWSAPRPPHYAGGIKLGMADESASGFTHRRFPGANDKCLFNSFLKVGNKLLVA
jgi:hypothetical protein